MRYVVAESHLTICRERQLRWELRSVLLRLTNTTGTCCIFIPSSGFLEALMMLLETHYIAYLTLWSTANL